MNDTPDSAPSSADDLLAAMVPLSASPSLEERLRQRTTGVVRRRRWFRRGGFAAALAACYAAGLLTMDWLPSPAVPDREPVRDHPAPLASSTPASKPGADKKNAETDDAPPVALEWQALDNPSKSPALLRAAGDRYLQDTGDVQSAVRCYRNLLEGESDADPTISADDSWLLMALKQARQREKRYAKNDG